MIGNHLVKHGDGVKDIAFEVEQLDIIVQVCLSFIFQKLCKFNKNFGFYSVQKNKERYLLKIFGQNQMNLEQYDLQL